LPERSQVVILGGGFAGLGAAKALQGADADVALIDRHNYHTFQPMLYQAATALVAPEEIAHPIRISTRGYKNCAPHETAVTGIDLANRKIQLKQMPPLDYDYLVIALGATVNFFGVKGAADHAFPLYTLPHALRLRDHLMERWESADKDPSLVEDGALNVVVVGGGCTGIESAGAIMELYRGNFPEDYRGLPARDARVILVERDSKLLGPFKEKLQQYTKKALEKRGVEIRLGEGVESIDQTRVTLTSGEVLKAHTLVWAAGLQANPLVQSLSIRLEHGGRIPVQPDLSLEEHPEVFAAGDVAWIADAKGGTAFPQLGSVAMQSGKCAGENIARRIKGEATKPFAYLDKGMMASIGRGAAVAQMPGGITLKGRMGILAWGGVHLALLSGHGTRLRTVVDWGTFGFTRVRAARVSIDDDED
jgi:NADH:ubiquinone reductase (H+-translocating)